MNTTDERFRDLTQEMLDRIDETRAEFAAPARCTVCHGVGTLGEAVTCRNCGGTGDEQIEAPGLGACHLCGGEGFTRRPGGDTCPACTGEGTLAAQLARLSERLDGIEQCIELLHTIVEQLPSETPPQPGTRE